METNEEIEIKGKILIVIAPSDFRDEELFETKKIFEENGYETEVTSSATGSIIVNIEPLPGSLSTPI